MLTQRTMVPAATAFSAILITIGAASGQGMCEPQWVPGFAAPGIGIAFWLPSGQMSGSIRAMMVYDDGSGPKLWVGGEFEFAGGVSAKSLATWDGMTWAATGSGVYLSSGDVGVVHAFCTFDDDGDGTASLFSGGKFNVVDDVSAIGVARWDGQTWSPLDAGAASSVVLDLVVFDDESGSGPALYASGDFPSMGGTQPNYVARWDGRTWSALGGEEFHGGNVNALEVFDDGSGPALYAGGEFTHYGGTTCCGGLPLGKIARWDGRTWSQVGGVVSEDGGSVYSLHVHDDGTGSALYAGGLNHSLYGFLSLDASVVRWDGASWSEVGQPPGNKARGLATFDDGRGPAKLVAGVYFGASIGFVGAWDGQAWTPLPGFDTIDLDWINDIAPDNDGVVDGKGPSLYAGGEFLLSGLTVSTSNMARWGATPQAGPADVYCDGLVNGYDIAVLLAAWGDCPKRGGCPADLNDDGVVNGVDLAMLLAEWS